MRYATYAEFTAVYSVRGMDQTDIERWLEFGALRINEELGAYYTVPFSSNNETAKDLSIHYAMYGILRKTLNYKDSIELKEDLCSRIERLKNFSPMLTASGYTVFPDGGMRSLWSSTEDYKPIFDHRDAIYQRVDPDLIDDEWDKDV